jgi:hypothetical protein
MRKIKRLPPIMFPIWLIVFIFDNCYKLCIWLIGKWNCKDCGKRYGIYDERFEVLYQKEIFKKGKLYLKYKSKKVCTSCYAKQQNKEQEQS